MNFDHMPELRWEWSYPALVMLMVVLEVLVFRLFKRRGWL
jgi:magnesium transporter